MPYLWFKSLHIIGVVVWFAGLFYLVRLFIYHKELHENKESAEIEAKLHSQYLLMESRLMNIITTPGAVFATLMAIGIVYETPAVLYQNWFYFKMFVVALLYAYHWQCYRILKKLAAKNCTLSSKGLRLFNEIPTFLLFAGVMLAVFKSLFPTQAFTWMIFALVILTILIIQKYAKYRKRKAND